MKFGLVFNPNAGDVDRVAKVIALLKNELGRYDLITTTPIFEFLKEKIPALDCVKMEVTNSWQDSVNAGYILSRIEDIKAIIVVGGDGTISDVVTGQRRAEKLIPIIGIGVGTANAGPLISFPLNKLTSISDEFVVRETMGIDVFYSKGYIATGFNDVVFSDCVVSTVDGRTVMVDAEEFLKGKRTIRTPGDIGMDETRISLNVLPIVTGREMKISQIIASPIHEANRFRYMAVTGLMCWIPYTFYRGILAVTNKPIVRLIKPEEREILTMKQCIFSEKDEVEIRNTRGYVVVDGNPRIDMAEAKTVYLKLNKRAALSARFT